MHTLLLTAFNFALGAALGVAGGLLGTGGGLIAIPVLGYLYGMDQHLAQGTALVMIVPNVLIGFLLYHQKHRVDLRSAAAMVLFATAGSYVAARLAAGISAGGLHTAFALFLIAPAFYFALPKWHAEVDGDRAASAPKPMPRATLPLLGIASGGMSGIFTVGGGLVVVPALVTLFGMQQTRAQGMALALVVPGALVAYAQGGNVSWATGLPMALGGVLSVYWGVALAHKLPAGRLPALFCVVLLGTAAGMLATSS